MIRFSIVVRKRFATHFQRGIPAASAAPGTSSREPSTRSASPATIGSTMLGDQPGLVLTVGVEHHHHVGVVLEGLQVAGLLVAAVADLMGVPDQLPAAARGPARRSRRSRSRRRGSSRRPARAGSPRPCCSSVAAAWRAGMTTTTFGSAAASPQRQSRRASRRPFRLGAISISAAAARWPGQQGERPRPIAARASPARSACSAPPGGGAPGRGRSAPGSTPTRPSSHPITIWPAAHVRHPLHDEARTPRAADAGCASTGARGGGGCRGAASGRRTTRAWRLSVFGTAIDDDAAGLEQPGRLADRAPGSGQVLERVPEDDGGPRPSLRPRSSGSSRRSSRGCPLEADGLAAPSRAAHRSACRPRRRRPGPGPGGAISSIRRREQRRGCGRASGRPTKRSGRLRGPVPVAVGARRARSSSGQGSVVAAPQRAQRVRPCEPERSVVERTRRTRRRSAAGSPSHAGSPVGLAAVVGRSRTRPAPVESSAAQLEVLRASIASARGSRVAAVAAQHGVVEALLDAHAEPAAAAAGGPSEQPVERRRAPRRRAPCSAGNRTGRACRPDRSAARTAPAARSGRTRRSGTGR